MNVGESERVPFFVFRQQAIGIDNGSLFLLLPSSHYLVIFSSYFPIIVLSSIGFRIFTPANRCPCWSK